MIKFNWHTFTELNIEQLYAVLALRSEIFVVEQRSAYHDPDGKDRDALHLLGMIDNSLAAYLRLFPPTERESSIVFGRVLIAKSERKLGYGKKLLEALLAYCETHYPDVPLKCSAQYHLVAFYSEAGFQAYGQPYDEDGIPHIAMIKPGVKG